MTNLSNIDSFGCQIFLILEFPRQKKNSDNSWMAKNGLLPLNVIGTFAESGVWWCLYFCVMLPYTRKSTFGTHNNEINIIFNFMDTK